MAFNLFSLLSQGASEIGPSLLPQEEIVVRGGGQQPDMANDPRFVLPDDLPSLGNARVLEELRANEENAPPREGMFGTKGTLRDILGTVGDAFINQAGGKSVYAPQRQWERESDAMAGFSMAPLAAIERLAAHNPEAAAKLLDDYQTNQVRQGNLQSQEAARKSLIGDRQFDNIGKQRLALQQLIMAAPEGQKAAALARFGPLLARQAGVDLEELGIMEGMTEEDLNIFGRGGMTSNQTFNAPLSERRVRATEQNADANTLRASRPPQGRAPQRRTVGDLTVQAFDTPADERTPEQQALVAKTLSQGSSRRRGGSSTAPVRSAPAAAPKVDTKKFPPGSVVRSKSGKMGTVQRDGTIRLNP